MRVWIMTPACKRENYCPTRSAPPFPIKKKKKTASINMCLKDVPMKPPRSGFTFPPVPIKALYHCSQRWFEGSRVENWKWNKPRRCNANAAMKCVVHDNQLRIRKIVGPTILPLTIQNLTIYTHMLTRANSWPLFSQSCIFTTNYKVMNVSVNYFATAGCRLCKDAKN